MIAKLNLFDGLRINFTLYKSLTVQTQKTLSTHLEGVFLLHKLYRHISQYPPRTLLIL